MDTGSNQIADIFIILCFSTMLVFYYVLGYCFQIRYQCSSNVEFIFYRLEYQYNALTWQTVTSLRNAV